jgi:hypothetical protein
MSSIIDPQRLVELVAHEIAHDASESAARRPRAEDNPPEDETKD